MEETGINNWYFGGSTWWERRILARLHSENKTSGGQSGMVWSVRFLDIFSFSVFLSSQGLHHVPNSIIIIIQKRGWDGRRYHSCPDTLFLLGLIWFSFNLSMSLFAHALSHII